MSAGQWVDLYVVEDEDGVLYEIYGDEIMAQQYVENINTTLRQHSKPLVIRHTTADIADY